MCYTITKMNKKCQAMEDAGISNPESQEGIDFCLECPYPSMICYEDGVPHTTTARRRNQKRAKELEEAGFSIKGIAEILGKSERTIGRYLSNGGYLD